MSRLLLPSSLIVIAGSLVALWVGQPQAAERLAPVGDATKKAPFEPLGVSSCASMACHHGNGERGSVGSEYSTWVAVDPHAKAYGSLYKPESIRMHEIMAKDDKVLLETGAHGNPLCLQCHGMGKAAPEAQHADGVGCERCHGNAEKWKATHYQNGFDRTKDGFVDLRMLPVRVETCVKCHVGDASGDVDHDLIAAGHPRLRFEYAAYYANYPKHWAEVTEGEKKNKSKDDEVCGWLLGQIVSARCAAELLAHRATNKPDSWPEFAEFDCAACHHGLAPPNFRNERDLELAKKAKPGEKIPLGRMPYGTWYNPLLPTLAGATKIDREKFDASRERLDKLMRKNVPSKAMVSTEAKTFAEELRVWEKAVADRSFDPTETRALIKVLAGRKDTVDSGWDGGTQVYLGLAALHHGLMDLDQKQKPFREHLLNMRKTLGDAYPKGAKARPRYDVPSDYHPAPLTTSLKKILEHLESKNATRD